MSCLLVYEHVSSLYLIIIWLPYKILFNPRPTKPFFVTWFTKGVVTTPL